ncbi:unnamed protein product [Aphanomyces euteiches]
MAENVDKFTPTKANFVFLAHFTIHLVMRIAILSVLALAMATVAAAADFLFVSAVTDNANSVGLSIFSTDPSNGQLTLANEFTSKVTGGMPTYMAFSHDQKFLYLVNSEGQGKVTSLRVRYDGNKIALDNLGRKNPLQVTAPTNSGGPVHLVVTQDNRFVITAGYGAGVVTVLEIESTGKAANIVDSVTFQGASHVVPDRQEGPHAHCVTLSPDNRYVYVTDLGNDKIMQFQFNRQTGKLRAISPSFVSTGAGSLPRHMVFHPRGDRLFLATEHSNELVLFDYNNTNGNLKLRQRVKTTNATDITTGAIHAAQDGHILVSNRGVQDSSVVVFTEDLRLISSARTSPLTKNGHPRDFTVFDGFVYAGNENTNNVVGFSFQNNNLGPRSINVARTKPQCLLGVQF